MIKLQSPVTLRFAFIALAMTLLIWLALLWLGVVLAQRYVQAHLPMQQVPLAIQLPKYMPVKSTVENQLTAHLNDTLGVAVDLDQMIEATLPRRFPVNINLQTQVNLVTEIHYQTRIPVSAGFELMVPVNTPVMSMRVPATLPLTFDVPVDIRIPVSETIPVNLATQVIAQITEPVPAHLKTTLISQVPINESIKANVLAEAEARLMFPTAPVALELAEADLVLRMADISLLRSALHYPKNKVRKVEAGDLIYVYDAANKPPMLR